MCLAIIQIFTIYGVIMSVISMFVALTQVDFMLIRIAADLIINHYTTYWFLRGKKVDPIKYEQWKEANVNNKELDEKTLPTSSTTTIQDAEPNPQAVSTSENKSLLRSLPGPTNLLPNDVL